MDIQEQEQENKAQPAAPPVGSSCTEGGAAVWQAAVQQTIVQPKTDPGHVDRRGGVYMLRLLPH